LTVAKCGEQWAQRKAGVHSGLVNYSKRSKNYTQTRELRLPLRRGVARRFAYIDRRGVSSSSRPPARDPRSVRLYQRETGNEECKGNDMSTPFNVQDDLNKLEAFMSKLRAKYTDPIDRAKVVAFLHRKVEDFSPIADFRSGEVTRLMEDEIKLVDL
jgi:hypothetical protein